MSSVPSYFKQESKSTCSLAVLRMVLSHFHITVTEEELLDKVAKHYGKHFTNIWNPTIAKLAREYGIDTTMYALWPLFKKDILLSALKEYETSRSLMDITKYENKHDTDVVPEPLPLAYKEMFEAITLGCHVEYGALTQEKIRKFLDNGALIQTTIKLHKMYPGKKNGLHSILIYGYRNNLVLYHDPYDGKELTCTIAQLLMASTDVGVGIVYNGKSI